MKRALEEFRAVFESFVHQQEHAFLVLGGGPVEFVAGASLLRQLDQGSETTVWAFVERFDHAEQYATTVWSSFATRYEELRSKVDDELRPSVPPFDLTPAPDPVERIRQILTFARDVLVGGMDVLLVALWPDTIADQPGWASLLRRLAVVDWAEPWFERLRIVVRDQIPDLWAAKAAELEGWGTAKVVDLGPDELAKECVAVVENERAPLAERIANLMMVAGTDLAMGRFSKAIERFALCADYYERTRLEKVAAGTEDPNDGLLVLEATARNQVGEAMARAGIKELAQERLEQALEVAIKSTSVAALLPCTLSLARFHEGHKEWKTAAEYWQAVQSLAQAARNPEMLAHGYEHEGSCHRAFGDTEAALKAWHTGVLLCRNLKLTAQLVELLQLEKRLFVDIGLFSRAREADRELQSLRGEKAGANA